MTRTAEPPPGISVVIPVYNSEKNLGVLLDRVCAALKTLGRDHEVVLVNDGSTDRSWERIVEESAQRPAVRGIRLMRNYGQHNALLCGVRAAHYSVTVTMDDDLQNPPEHIGDLVAELERGHDLIYGTSQRKQHSLGHVLAARLLRLGLATVLGAGVGAIASPFRAFRTGLRDGFRQAGGPWIILDVYLAWTTGSVGAVEVPHEPRQRGKVSYTVRKRAQLALDMITGFSTVPLKLASIVGVLFGLFGVGVLIYVLTVFVLSRGENVPGFAFLASTIAIFSGAQLFALGILGEYLARLFDRVMGRPPYSVAATTESD